jgi:hypothetical protein
MRAVYAQIQERYGAAVPYPMAIFRGDSWQVYVADAAQALRIALSFRAALQAEASVDTRVGLALDTVDTVDESNVSASMGLAFQRSGQALDTLQTPRRMRCLVPEAAEDIMQLGADAVCDLADHLAIHWTDAQAQAVALRLMLTTDKSPPSQRDIAHHWQPEPITQQAVSKHLQQAAWRRLEAALNYFNWLVSYLLQNELP